MKRLSLLVVLLTSLFSLNGLACDQDKKDTKGDTKGPQASQTQSAGDQAASSQQNTAAAGASQTATPGK